MVILVWQPCKIVTPSTPKDKYLLENTSKLCIPPLFRRAYTITISQVCWIRTFVTHSKNNNMGTLEQF